MPDQALAEILAKKLPALSHPDGTPRRMANFDTSTLPPAMAEMVTKSSNDVGLAIVHTIEQEGYTILRNDELVALRNKATEIGDRAPINIHCNMCDTFLMGVTVNTPGKITTNGQTLLNALSKRSPECPHGEMA